MRVRSLRLPTLVLTLAACGPTQPPPAPLGAACDPALAPGQTAPECADGLCVALDTASGFCTRNCSEDSQCPNGYQCDSAGRFGRICKRLTGCTTDATCPAGHSCDSATGNCFIKVSRTLCSPCEDVAQCPDGGACFTALGSGEQFCTAPCGPAGPDGGLGSCPAGYACETVPAGPDYGPMQQCVPVAQTCNQGKPLCAPCKGDNECGGPFDLCVRNVVSGEQFCGTDCAPDAGTPCPTGFSCVDIGQGTDPNTPGPFQCVPNSNTCADFCNAPDELGQLRQCGIGKTCDVSSDRCLPATDGRECAPCSTNDDCASGLHPEDRCLVNDCASCPYKGQAFCATPCADTAACEQSFGVGFICSPVAASDGTVTSYCMPQRGTCQSGLGRIGDDCSVNGAADCLAGICVEEGLIAFCSAPCTQDSDCGSFRYQCCEYTAAGYDCSPAKRGASGPASGAGICAPTGGLFGDDCSPGQPPCESGTCLDLGTARVCTVPCSQGCPAGYECRPAQTLDGNQSLDVCFPSGGGAAGADCSFGPAACASGLCIRKDSGNVCTAACQTAADCPQGWSCSQLHTIDFQSVVACLPPTLQ